MFNVSLLISALLVVSAVQEEPVPLDQEVAVDLDSLEEEEEEGDEKSSEEKYPLPPLLPPQASVAIEIERQFPLSLTALVVLAVTASLLFPGFAKKRKSSAKKDKDKDKENKKESTSE